MNIKNRQRCVDIDSRLRQVEERIDRLLETGTCSVYLVDWMMAEFGEEILNVAKNNSSGRPSLEVKTIHNLETLSCDVSDKGDK